MIVDCGMYDRVRRQITDKKRDKTNNDKGILYVVTDCVSSTSL